MLIFTSSAVRSPMSRLYFFLIYWMIELSSSSPPTRTDREATIPPREMTATSLVPPPMSTTMLPVASATGRPAPMAAAMGSSMMETCLAPALKAASRTARRSTSVTPEGMQMIIRGWARMELLNTFLMKIWSMEAVMSKSAITPSFSGRTATMLPGVRPMTSLASIPTYRTVSLRVSTATTDGSRMMIPLPFMKIRVLAVPRSIPISFENENMPHVPLVGSSFLQKAHPPGGAWKFLSL